VSLLAAGLNYTAQCYIVDAPSLSQSAVTMADGIIQLYLKSAASLTPFGITYDIFSFIKVYRNVESTILTSCQDGR
jgi:hypothetical protein